MANVNQLVAKKVKEYRELTGHSQGVLAQLAYIPLDAVEKIEKGFTFENKFYYLMKIAETLGVTYYDFFEKDDGSIAARNVPIPQEAINKFFEYMNKRGVTQEEFCKAIGTKKNSVWYWKSGRSVPSPFLFYNACSFLGMNSESFKDVVTETKEVQAHKINAEEKKEEKPVGLMMGEVIKACQVYQKLDSVISQLDEIIKTATDLKAELEKERA
jgi:transcriptional regulator with XRE-family HTH domain